MEAIVLLNIFIWVISFLLTSPIIVYQVSEVSAFLSA